MCRPPGYLTYIRLPTPIHVPPPVPPPITYYPQPIPPPVRQESFPLPLKSVSVEAKVADFCASVTVRQKFVNVEKDPIEAVYQFRLEEKATVSEFVAIVDGNKIKGVIQEKEQAKDTYDDAIASGHGAFMMEEKEDEPNIFTVNVGNLAPGKEVDIAITYVTELQFEDGQLKFVLPSNNDNPSYKASSDGSVPHLKLRADFSMTSNIRSMSSPSHPISFEFGEEPNQATVTLGDSPQASSAKDFVILTKLAKPHQPCCRVEVDEKGNKTVMAAIYPQLELADEEDVYTEMIFIVDRSRSMSGARINQVKNTLQIFLRSLGEGTMFNIIGFGTRMEQLFKEGSVEYNDKNLDIATKHVQGMFANLGGTDILKPLQQVLQSKPREGYPRQLFVLTDGEVNNTQQCIDFVRAHADTTRVFTFGIGNEASQDLVKGLAKAGEGFFEFIRSGEAMEEKVMRQLQRAMQPALTDITVTWKGAAAANVKPAPFRFAPLFCGGRLVTYGLLDKTQPDGEVEVVIEAKTAVKPFQVSIKADTSKATTGQLFSKLAAKTLLKDLDEARSYIHEADGRVKSGKNVVSEAVKISLESGVLSKHTAFVAVEERDEATEGTMKVRKITFEKMNPIPVPSYHPSIGVPMHPPPPVYRSGPTTGGYGAIPISVSSSSFASFGPPPPAPAGGPPRPLASGPPPPPGGAAPPARSAPLAKGFAMSGPPPPPSMACAPMMPCAPPPAPMCQAQASPRAGAATALLSSIAPPKSFSSVSHMGFAAEGASMGPARQRKSQAQDSGSGSAPAPAQMREIIMKQKASGSWDWADAVALLHLSADKLRAGIPTARLQTVDHEVESVWATAVVAAFLKKQFADQKTNWDLVVKKALKFIARQKKNIKTKNPEAEIDWLELAAAFLA